MEPAKTSSPLRILLVEDNEHDRLAFRRAFKKSQVSCEITECVRAEEALELLRADTSSFDLVVNDHGLPGMSGLDLCKELLDEEIPLPLVILTRTGSELLAVEALKVGVDNYMIKDPGQGYLNLLPVVLPDVVRKHGDRLARKRAEESLRKSEERFQQVAENAHELIWEVDAQGLYTYVSPIVEKILGYKAEQVVGEKHFYDLFHPENREELKGAAFKVFAEKQPFREFINRNVHKDGRTVWLSTSGIPILDETGSLLGYRGADIDITGRKKAEEALRESEERYRTLFEESRDAIYMTNRKGKFVDVNQSSLDLFGYTKEEMIGLDIKEMCVRPDDGCWFEQEIEQKGSVRDFEVKFRKKNGTQMDCLLTATLRRANDGSIIGEQGIIRDMTERKRLEAQLRQAQKMEALGRLAAGVAHEINNPLTIILTSAMLIQEDIDRDDPNFVGLETITNETVRCRNIVSNLLDFARQTRSAKGEHHINDIVIESMRLTKKKAAFKHVAVTHELSEDIPIISVDKNQILQCFVNLALNAIEATDPDGRITVATRFLPPDELIEVAIIDTGKGIAEDKIDKIFDPFFTTKQGGTGLGLSITRSIIEQHGGRIDVKSEPGHGTTFTIRLPISKIHDETEAR
jgi:PAS domain S-box-containing protein